MTFPVRFHWTLGVAASLALVATACDGDLTEPAPTTDAAGEVLPEAPSAVVPDGHVVLGEFEVSVNPYIGHVDLRWLEPTDYFSDVPLDDLRTVQQADFCENRVTAGRPNTVTLDTVAGSIGYDQATCGVSGFPFDTTGIFCFEADLTNNYSVPLTEAYAEILVVNPDVGHNGYRYNTGVQTTYGADPATVGLEAAPSERPSDLLGLFGFGQIDAGATSRVSWGFEYIDEPFSFRGRIMGIVPESCNNIDDDCDGAIDERALCYAGTEPCLVDEDCASGFCDGGTCSVVDLCTSGSLDSLETDVDCGGPICAGCTYGQMCNDNSDCASDFCRSGQCANFPHPGVGDVVVSEIFPNPAGGDSGKEWVEFYNAGSETFDIGLCILGDQDSDSHDITSELLIAPGAYVVLAQDIAAAGVGADYEYSSYFLSNSGDEVVLNCGGQDIDVVTYSSSFDVSGVSNQLDVNSLDAASNDSESAFCSLVANVYDDGTADSSGNVQYGTPGTANASCDVTIDRCRFAAPVVDFDAQESSNFTLAGQIRSLGLTDDAVGHNPYSRIVAEVGFGPTGDDPSVDDTNWSFFAASGDFGFSDPTDDQYTGDITTPAGVGSQFNVAFRASGDGGTTFTYCDLDQGAGADGSENGFALADVPTMTLIGTIGPPTAAGEVRISELMPRSRSGSDNGEWFELWNTTGVEVDLGGCEICDDDCDGSGNEHTIAGQLLVPAGGYVTLGDFDVQGFTIDYNYGTGITLSNSSDDLRIECGGTLIDSVRYETSTSNLDPGEILISTSTPGVAAQLIPDDVARLAVHGDITRTWCSTLPSNNYGNNGSNDLVGSPGAANPECVQLVNCNTQFPSVETGVRSGSSFEVFGRLTTVELTGLTNGADTSRVLISQLGYGPDDASVPSMDPSVDDTGWTWLDAAANQPFTDATGVDEYMASFPVTGSASTYQQFAYRVSDDGGASWTYCDEGDIVTGGALDGFGNITYLQTDATYVDDGVDFCNVQFPENITDDAGRIRTVFSQLFIDNLTNTTPFGSQPANMVSQFGYTNAGSTPNDVDWTWAETTGFSDLGANLEFSYDLTVPSAVPGPYTTAFRYSGDGGQSWYYCGASNTHDADPAAITPGTMSPAVRTPTYGRQNFPTSISGSPGDPVTVYGVVFAAGLTDQTDGTDLNSDFEAEFGYGADGSDPTVDFATWTWTPATPNLGWNDMNGADNNNDEYQADINLPLTPAMYFTAYRFRANSTDSWLYADVVGSPWSAANTGTMTVAGASGACTTGVLFSEYMEGSSQNKAIEIWNCSGADIDPADVELIKYSNANSTPDGGFSAPSLDDYGLSGVFAAGDVFVICNSSISAGLGVPCDHSTGGSPVNFNGNDPLVLSYQGTVVDSLGLILTSASYAANQTLERNNCTGDGDPLTDGLDGTQNFTSLSSNTNSSFGSAPAGVTCP